MIVPRCWLFRIAPREAQIERGSRSGSRQPRSSRARPRPIAVERRADEHVAEQLERRRERLHLRRPLDPGRQQRDGKEKPPSEGDRRGEEADAGLRLLEEDDRRRRRGARAATNERQPTTATGRLSGTVAQRSGIPNTTAAKAIVSAPLTSARSSGNTLSETTASVAPNGRDDEALERAGDDLVPDAARQRGEGREHHLHDHEADDGEGEVRVRPVERRDRHEPRDVVEERDAREASEAPAPGSAADRSGRRATSRLATATAASKWATAVLTSSSAGLPTSSNDGVDRDRTSSVVGAHQTADPAGRDEARHRVAKVRRDRPRRGSCAARRAARGGVVQERHREPQTLPLAHREPVGALSATAARARMLQRPLDRCASLATGHEGEARPVLEMARGRRSARRAPSGPAGRKPIRRWYSRRSRDGVSPSSVTVRVGRDEPGEDPEQRGLAGAVVADERQRPALLERRGRRRRGRGRVHRSSSWRRRARRAAACRGAPRTGVAAAPRRARVQPARGIRLHAHGIQFARALAGERQDPEAEALRRTGSARSPRAASARRACGRPRRGGSSPSSR